MQQKFRMREKTSQNGRKKKHKEKTWKKKKGEECCTETKTGKQTQGIDGGKHVQEKEKTMKTNTKTKEKQEITRRNKVKINGERRKMKKK